MLENKLCSFIFKISYLNSRSNPGTAFSQFRYKNLNLLIVKNSSYTRIFLKSFERFLCIWFGWIFRYLAKLNIWQTEYGVCIEHLIHFYCTLYQTWNCLMYNSYRLKIEHSWNILFILLFYNFSMPCQLYWCKNQTIIFFFLS